MLRAFAYGLCVRPLLLLLDLFTVVALNPRMLLSYLRMRQLLAANLHVSDDGDDVTHDDTWGFTPVFTAIKILKAAGVTHQSHVIDVGAGVGHVCFAARLLGARATGYERMAHRGQRALHVMHDIDVAFHIDDALVDDVDFASATHVYAACTTWTEASRAQLVTRVFHDNPKVVLVTITHPPSPEVQFSVLESLERFSWGQATVCISRRAHNTES